MPIITQEAIDSTSIKDWFSKARISKDCLLCKHPKELHAPHCKKCTFASCMVSPHVVFAPRIFYQEIEGYQNPAETTITPTKSFTELLGDKFAENPKNKINDVCLNCKHNKFDHFSKVYTGTKNHVTYRQPQWHRCNKCRCLIRTEHDRWFNFISERNIRQTDLSYKGEQPKYIKEYYFYKSFFSIESVFTFIGILALILTIIIWIWWVSMS